MYVGVGSNMGERQAWIDMAAEALRSDGNNRNFRSAQVIETEPYGYLEQDKFLNTVFTFESLYEPEELLLRMQEIEKEAHRERKIHWGPRTLDLDLLLYDNRITESPVLTIPHPEMTKRLFVLIPLCELNPHGVHPLYRKRFAEYKEALEQQENK